MMPDNTPHVPTEKTRIEVSALASFGNTQEEIALYLDICVDTLVKYYRRELDTAVIKSNAMVARGLFNKATQQDDLSAQIFWLKTRARWRTADSEHEQKAVEDANMSLKMELMDLRKKLDAKNRSEY
jgi:DNA-binding CsgD family transcriptional regulator